MRTDSAALVGRRVMPNSRMVRSTDVSPYPPVVLSSHTETAMIATNVCSDPIHSA